MVRSASGPREEHRPPRRRAGRASACCRRSVSARERAAETASGRARSRCATGRRASQALDAHEVRGAAAAGRQLAQEGALGAQVAHDDSPPGRGHGGEHPQRAAQLCSSMSGSSGRLQGDRRIWAPSMQKASPADPRRSKARRTGARSSPRPNIGVYLARPRPRAGLRYSTAASPIIAAATSARSAFVLALGGGGGRRQQARVVTVLVTTLDRAHASSPRVGRRRGEVGEGPSAPEQWSVAEAPALVMRVLEPGRGRDRSLSAVGTRHSGEPRAVGQLAVGLGAVMYGSS